MSTVGGKVYNLLFKKSSTYIATLFAGVFLFEGLTEQGSDSLFNRVNRGKQWADIKNSYVKRDEEQEDAE
jgi:ubiquinol-cytochrome c reductase subunit 9